MRFEKVSTACTMQFKCASVNKCAMVKTEKKTKKLGRNSAFFRYVLFKNINL